MTLPLSPFLHPADSAAADEALLDDARGAEWLETDGVGGFACSTVTMCPSRRYHGLLVAPRPGTLGRYVFLSGLLEQVDGEHGRVRLSVRRQAGDDAPGWPTNFERFGLEPWPRTVFRYGPAEIRREILMVKGRHAVLVRYGLAADADAPVTVTLRPLTAFREADELTMENDELHEAVEATLRGITCQPYALLPAMTIALRHTCSDNQAASEDGDAEATWAFTAEPAWVRGVHYDTDLARGYECHEDLFSPGRFEIRLAPGESLTLCASIDDVPEDPAELFEREASTRHAALPETLDFAGRCAVSADDFLYRAPEHRAGVLAGFPWFGEWGRDTFIALPGLTLARGRLADCAAVLSGALPYLQDGLLPNVYGADPASSRYDSADAALWFARAVLLYDRAGGPKKQVRGEYLPALIQIAEAYRAGEAPALTALGIGCDDGLLVHAGSPSQNLTWMDARTDGRAVTPRDGCTVESAALWVSLLTHIAELCPPGATRANWKGAARQAGRSFLARFWLEDQGILADVWRPNEVDASVRPNMVLAASLEFSPLSRARRARILARAETDLLTPFGLRTLAPDHPDYAARYAGGPEQRDAAYHQGTAWPWLLGFYCEAALRVDKTAKGRARLRALWGTLAGELDHGGLGHISEVYSADAPHDRGGTFAQAWNTGEALRALALIDGALPLRGARK